MSQKHGRNLNRLLTTVRVDSPAVVERWTHPCHVYTPTSLQALRFLSLYDELYLFCVSLFMRISACVVRDDEFSIPHWIGWLSCRVCNGLARALTDEYRCRCGSRRICRACPQAWPSRSPDLTARQFCLRGKWMHEGDGVRRKAQARDEIYSRWRTVLPLLRNNYGRTESSAWTMKRNPFVYNHGSCRTAGR